MMVMFRKGKSIVSLLRESENNDLRKFAKELLDFIHSSNERFQLLYFSTEDQKCLSIFGKILTGADVFTALAIGDGKLLLAESPAKVEDDCKGKMSIKSNSTNNLISDTEFAHVVNYKEPFYRITIKVLHSASFIANAFWKIQIAKVPEAVPYSFFHNLYSFVEQKYDEFASSMDEHLRDETTIQLRLDACLQWMLSQLSFFSDIVILKHHIDEYTPLPATEETILENVKPQIEAYVLVDTIDSVMCECLKSVLADCLARESEKPGVDLQFDFSQFCQVLLESFSKVCDLQSVSDDMIKDWIQSIDFDELFLVCKLQGCPCPRDQLFCVIEECFTSLVCLFNHIRTDAEKRGSLSRVFSQGLYDKQPSVQVFSCATAAHAELYLFSQLFRTNNDLLCYVSMSADYCAFCSHIFTQLRNTGTTNLHFSFPWSFEEIVQSEENLKVLLGDSLYLCFDVIRRKPNRYFKDLVGEESYPLLEILKLIMKQINAINDNSLLDFLGIPNENKISGIWPCSL